MFKNKTVLLFLILNLIFLSSCSSLKKGLGVEKDVPNEFLIEKKDSLVLPPDYKILPPDTKNTQLESKKSDSSLQSIFDQNTKAEDKKSDDLNKKSSELEKEILNQIK